MPPDQMLGEPPVICEESVEERIVLTLVDLANHLTRNGEEMAAQADLTVQQWLTLLQVAGDPNLPRVIEPREERASGVLASEMARSRGISRASVSSQVTALVRKGLVHQVEDPADRRRKALRLTAAGSAALAAVEPSRHAANRALFRPWSNRELADLQAILQSCLSRLAELRERRRRESRPGSALASTKVSTRSGEGR